ncbi:MAG TPA: Ku protein [Acetobacteraceae bacterium]|jgi:DNA end-binding protein Ku|nr:Ku protein [Acetobacteraceae bacterium]
MPQRPIWRGHLRLALVSCPVALYNARHDRGAIRFNLINPVTGNRIRMVSLDAETGEEVARRDTVKGYEFKKDHYLLMTDEDFDKVKVESSSLMAVEKFVEAASIDPIYYDASYYLAPDGKGSEDVYAVLREAIEKTGKVALTRVVISQRERTIAIRPMDGGLVAQTLNQESDLNSAKPLFENIQHVKVDPAMVTLAVQLVERQAGEYDPSDLEDRYETRLRAVIDAKLRGEGESLEDVPAQTESNVIDLMAALKKSLGQPPQEEVPAAKPAPAKRKKVAAEEDLRRQPAFKLPIEGGRKPAKGAEKAPEPEIAPRRSPARRKAS